MTNVRKKVGLLVMAYGTPYKPSDIKRYYTHIRGGKEPSEEALKDLTEKYAALGGVSPMAQITEDQAKHLEKKLNDMQNEYEFKMYLGLRHIEPFIEEAIQSMAEDGFQEAVSIVLAPHYSTYSIKEYNGRAQKEAEKHNISLTSVEHWHQEPGFIKYWADEIAKVYEEMSHKEREKAVLIVSAHSLPKRIVEDNDPYIDQLKETALLISEETGIQDYEIAWQSEGNTPVPWLEPDVLDLTRELYSEKGYRTFVYAPVGFVSDHLETLYDNDIECKEVCDELGAAYYRPEMPNTHPLFIESMAKVVLEQLSS